MGPRINGLDALRGIAILLVALDHYMPQFIPALAGSSAPFLSGSGGVILFFFLSGYLIDRNLSIDGDMLSYGVRRAMRILPMYWLSILLVVALDHHWRWQDVALNAGFLAPIAKAERMSGVYWTLYIEILFYCVAPFLKLLDEMVLKFVPYLFLGSYAVIWLQVGGLPGLAPYHLIYCIAGMQFGAWQRGTLSDAGLATLVATMAICGGVFSPVSLLVSVAVLLSAGLLWFALRHGLDSRVLAFIGTVSYSWYLLHTIVGFSICDMVMSAGAPDWAAGIAALLATLALASTTYVVLERTAIDLARRFLAGRGPVSRVSTSSP